MRTIGLIGGLAWPSTIEYYRGINTAIQAQLGVPHCARLVLAQFDFADVDRCEVAGEWDAVGEMMLERARGLAAAGAELFLIACNSVHAADAVIEAGAPLPFIHIVDPAAAAIMAAGYRRVGLIGSRYTMAGDYFSGRLRRRYGLDVLVPDGPTQDVLHGCLIDEISRAVVTDATRALFYRAIESLRVRGAECIVLGCTEFNLVVDQAHSALPVIDTTACHVAAAVAASLAADVAVLRAVPA